MKTLPIYYQQRPTGQWLMQQLKYKCLGLIVLLGLTATTSVTKAQRLSDRAQFSIITIGPYQSELYSAWGHGAIRLNDPGRGWDMAFNYGIFDFDQPNFYVNFALGKLYYKLGINRFQRMKNFHISENRYVYEQILDLTPEEKEKLFALLEENAKPENRNYFYNYVYNNCATKIRDVIELALEDSIDYNYSYVKEPLSFRDLMDAYLSEQPWGDFAIDVCLGQQVDRQISGYEYMFLPDYIMYAFDGATRKGDSEERPLVKTTITWGSQGVQPSNNTELTPMLVFSIIFLVLGFVTYRELKSGKRSRWIDFLLFFVTGLVGFFLLFLWFGTDHLSKYNLNLLWAMPLNLAFAFVLLKSKNAKLVMFYALAFAILQGALILLWGVLPQPLHLSLVPLALLMLIRSLYIYFDVKKGGVSLMSLSHKEPIVEGVTAHSQENNPGIR